MADHGMQQMSLSNTSSDNSSNQQLPPYNPNIGGSSQNPFNIPPPKKPRGRPPGSKNKPKPQLVVTQENDRAVRKVMIEVAAGTDIVEAIVQYALRRRTGLSIVSGAGTINKATLRYPLPNSPAVTLHGPFSLLTLSGTIMYPPSPPPPHSSSNPNRPPKEPKGFGITLCGVQGQIFGGVIGGKVVAGGDTVEVMCTIFKNAELHRAGGVNDVGEEGDYEYDDDDGGDGDGDGDGDGGNPNVGGTGEGSGASGSGGNASMPAGGFMHWTHPNPPNY